MKVEENNYAFIDSTNLYQGIKDLGWTIDMERFRVYLLEKYFVQQAFLFMGYIQKNNSLYTKLKNQGYQTIFKPIIHEQCGEIKGNCDSELVMHAILKREEYTKAVVVSGDGDFYCLIEFLKNKNQLKKLIVPNRRKYSSLYRRILVPSKDIVFLDECRKKLMYNKTPR